MTEKTGEMLGVTPQTREQPPMLPSAKSVTQMEAAEPQSHGGGSKEVRKQGSTANRWAIVAVSAVAGGEGAG